MRRVEQVGAAVVEHGPPTGRRRRHAETEKAHCCFREDGSGHADGGLHDYGLNNVWENVTHNDAQVTGAEGACSFDEFTLTRCEDLSANQAGVADPSS